MAYGWALEDTTSFCKLIADRSTRPLVGAHIIGPHASSLIQQLVQAMHVSPEPIDEWPPGSTGSTRRSARSSRTPCSGSHPNHTEVFH